MNDSRKSNVNIVTATQKKSEISAQVQLDQYVEHVRAIYGKTAEANNLIVEKGRELGISVAEIDVDEQKTTSF